MENLYSTEPGLRTPVYVVDEAALIHNLEILQGVQQRTGCHILLAQKAFSMFRVYPLIGRYLAGATASGLFEARLAHEGMPGRENHVFSPAYTPEEMQEIVQICDHISFNSLRQLEHHRPVWEAAGVSVGLRVNPECSTQEGHAIYDPCAPFSRLGTTLEKFEEEMSEEDISALDGLHFHTLCEQDSDDLAKTLQAVEEKFGKYLHRMKWVNFGGGHHITRPGYDIGLLKRCIRHMQETYGVEVYLEPGEAVALNAGELITEVLEIVENGMRIAVMDASAACHMPDVLEMPYRPPLKDAGDPAEENAGGCSPAGSGPAGSNPAGNSPADSGTAGCARAYVYRLAGPTCLAGDVIGDYSFAQPLRCGDRLEFQDMAIYTMVKTNTFNGMRLPDIVLEREDGTCEIVKTFGYEDFKARL